jgi:phage-related protein
MTDVVLTAAANWQSTKKVKARMLSQQFGDGYAQDAPDGINNTPQEWNITVEYATKTVIDGIESSLISAMGVRILWTPPTTGASQLKWRVPESWDRKFHAPDVESISFVLRQAF